MKTTFAITTLLLLSFIGMNAEGVIIKTTVELRSYIEDSPEYTRAPTQSTDTLSAPAMTSRPGETARIQIAQNFELEEQDDIPVGLSVWVRPILEGDRVTFTGRFELTELLSDGMEFERETPVFEKLIIPFTGNVILDEKVHIDAGTTYRHLGFMKEEEPRKLSRLLVISFSMVEPVDAGNGGNAPEDGRSP